MKADVRSSYILHGRPIIRFPSAFFGIKISCREAHFRAGLMVRLLLARVAEKTQVQFFCLSFFLNKAKETPVGQISI